MTNDFSFQRAKDLALISTEFTALEMAAEQMRLAATLDPDRLTDYISSEESTVYSQAIHFTYRMVYLLIPLDAATKRHRESNHHHHHHHQEDERASNIVRYKIFNVKRLTISEFNYIYPNVSIVK